MTHSPEAASNEPVVELPTITESAVNPFSALSLKVLAGELLAASGTEKPAE